MDEIKDLADSDYLSDASWESLDSKLVNITKQQFHFSHYKIIDFNNKFEDCFKYLVDQH